MLKCEPLGLYENKNMKTELPTKVTVCGQDYSLSLMSAVMCDMGNCSGFVSHEALTIHIKQGLPAQKLAEVIVHELTHCILYAFHSQNEEDEESQVDRTARGFACLMRDNPELFEFLAEAVR